MSAYEVLFHVREARFSRDRLFGSCRRCLVGCLAQAVDRSLSMDHGALELESGPDRYAARSPEYPDPRSRPGSVKPYRFFKGAFLLLGRLVLNALLSIFFWVSCVALIALLYGVQLILLVLCGPFDKQRKILHRQCFWWCQLFRLSYQE